MQEYKHKEYMPVKRVEAGRRRDAVFVDRAGLDFRLAARRNAESIRRHYFALLSFQS
jgi:hypothetical protein